MPPVAAESASKKKEHEVNPKALDFDGEEKNEKAKQDKKRLRKMATRDCEVPEVSESRSSRSAVAKVKASPSALALVGAEAKAKAKPGGGKSSKARAKPGGGKSSKVKAKSRAKPKAKSSAKGKASSSRAAKKSKPASSAAEPAEPPVPPTPVPPVRVRGKSHPTPPAHAPALPALPAVKEDTSTPAREVAKEVREALAKSATTEMHGEDAKDGDAVSEHSPKTSPGLDVEEDGRKKRGKKYINEAERKAAHARFMRFSRSLQSQGLSILFFHLLSLSLSLFLFR